ncbi:hypothetical protein Tco_1235893 [Tanacetum coccineum]
MSSASSAVTYTSVYTDFEPDRVFWGADDKEITDGGIPRVIVYRYDGLPMQPVTLPSPDYIPGLEEPQTPPVPQDEDERESIYPDYIPLEDEHVFLVEEQPLPPVDSPTTESPGYVTESDPEEDLEEYEDDETEDGPVDYPMDGGDDGDDDEGDSSMDDADDDDEEEHPAPADSVASISLPPEAEALVDAVTAALPSPPLPPLPPSLYIPPPVDRRDDIPESEQPPRKRLCLSTLGFKYEVGESSTTRPTRGRGIDYRFISTVDDESRRQGISEVGYGIRYTWVDLTEAVPKIAPTTLGEVSTRVAEVSELHERDTQDLYALLEDAQDGRTRISQRVTMDSQRVDLLMGDKMTLQETAVHYELQTHHDHVYAYETHIQAHQAQLQLQSTLIQTQYQVELLALRGQHRARQPGPDARIPDHQDASEDTDSHI